MWLSIAALIAAAVAGLMALAAYGLGLQLRDRLELLDERLTEQEGRDELRASLMERHAKAVRRAIEAQKPEGYETSAQTVVVDFGNAPEA